MSSALSRRSETAARWAAVALGASIPVSVALDNVLAGLILLLSLAALRFRERLGPALRNPVALAALALLAWLALGLAWGPREGTGTLGKYADLLLVPLLIALFADARTRHLGLMVFAGALVLSLAVSFAVAAGIGLPDWFTRGTPKAPTAFKLYLTHSILMAYGAFLFALLARESGGGARRVWAVLAVASAANALMMPGRTGYVVLLGLLALLLVAAWPRRGLVAAAAAVLAVSAGAYLGSETFRGRIDKAAAEFVRWQPGAVAGTTDSIGTRLEYYHETLGLIAAHPALGVGTGGFPKAYAERVAGSGRQQTDNAHNEYLMVAAQVGIPGALLLVALFALQWRLSARLPSALERDLARGLVWTFAAGCLFNSMLLDHTEGMLFAWLSGLLFAGLQSASASRASPLPPGPSASA